MRHALITGGAGFIGLHLARHLLAHGWRVDLLDNFQRGARDDDLTTLVEHDDARLISGDLGDTALAGSLSDGYSHVFHFAAMLGVRAVAEHPGLVLSANVALTEAALEIGRRQRGLERFVVASTSEVYAGTLAQYRLDFPTPETTPLALPDLAIPRTSYMLSKIYGEAMCRHAGLPATIVRPHNVYGPRMGMAHVIPELLDRTAAAPDGGALEVYSVEHTRTFCYVDDAAEMIRRLAEAEAAEGATVNVGTETPEIAIGALAEAVIALLDKDLTIKPLPPTTGSPSRRAPDMGLCATLTGYRSTVELKEGLRRTWDWYSERRPGG